MLGLGLRLATKLSDRDGTRIVDKARSGLGAGLDRVGAGIRVRTKGRAGVKASIRTGARRSPRARAVSKAKS